MALPTPPTRLRLAPAAADSSYDPVGDLLAEVCAEFRAHSLVEDRDGRVVAHALREGPPPAVADAVLKRDARLLHAAAATRRTAAVLPAGPVQALRLGRSMHALVVPLAADATDIGWWWLIADRPLAMTASVGDRAAALTCVLTGIASAEPPPDAAASLLSGHGRLPERMCGLPLHVAVVHAVEGSASGVASVLRRTVDERPAGGLAVLVADTGAGADLIVAGAPEDVAPAVTRWCKRAGEQLRVGLAAGLAEPVTEPAALPAARAQAAAVVEAAGRSGHCLTVAAARSAVVLEHLGPALDTLPPLGRDPVQDLLGYDAKRRSDLARSLLAWLDTHGDVPAAAEVLSVHCNTLRYRISRAMQVLGVDLVDPAVRLEVHLRLRRWRRSP